MIHERADYNKRVQCLDGSIPADEPVFLLRGKDMFAAQVVEYWVFLRRNNLSPEKQQSVLHHAKRMKDYEWKWNDSGCTS